MYTIWSESLQLLNELLNILNEYLKSQHINIVNKLSIYALGNRINNEYVYIYNETVWIENIVRKIIELVLIYFIPNSNKKYLYWHKAIYFNRECGVVLSIVSMIYQRPYFIDLRAKNLKWTLGKFNLETKCDKVNINIYLSKHPRNADV